MQVSAQDLIQKAHDLMLKGDLNQADEIFNLLCNDNINSEELLFHLGSVNMKKGRNALALLLLKEVLRLKPDFLEAVNNLGYVYKQLQMVEEARIEFERLIELSGKNETSDTDKSEYLTNLGSTYVANGTPKKALEILDKAIELNKDNVMARWNCSLAHLELGDYENGFEEYEFGERTERCKNRKYGQNGLPVPVWNGELGKTIVVYGEQGIGDELMFASILPDVMADCNVILDAHPRLADLFRINYPFVPIYGTRKTDQLPWAEYHQIDAMVSIGSLGKFYRKRKENFPGQKYLVADAELVKKYREKLSLMGNKPKIGISWVGGIKRTNMNERYIKLDLWKEIFSAIGADFISLQYNKGIGEEVKKFEQQNNICLNHWQDTLDDYDETAGLVSNLDLIISVPQSVVHLAGALGTPTWQLCPKKALWQMGVYGEDMPWYSCVKNIWQGEDYKWPPIMKKVKEDLCDLLQMRIAA